MAELTVLLVGAGGREHALAWRLSLSPRVRTVFVAPGNAGTASSSPKIINVDLVPQIRDDWNNFVDFALNNHVNLVVPGPEQPLVDGIELAFRKVGIPVFGPTPTAALMEGSKSAAKAFIAKHNLPTASYRSFVSSQLSETEAYVKEQYAKGEEKLVIKASGLAAGKGVVIAESEKEATEAVRAMLVGGVFGDAGHEIILESHLSGPELSLLAFSDGYTVLPLPPAQDHKRIGENDTGPNTGGMGAYAPAPEAVASREVVKEMERIVERCVAGMRRDGFPFTGLLFTGFILTSSGPKILEFNVRFGDPETEALMLLLSPQTDLAEIMLACVDHRLDAVSLTINPGFAVSVVLASKGYPGSYEKGKVITIQNDEIPKDVQIFHAGTSLSPSNPQEVVTSGGRVLVVAAYAHTLEGALKLAYDAVKCISFEGMVYRTDIGYRALQPTATLQPLTYASAGVSVAHGNDLVSLIKPLIKSTARPGSDASIGGFGGVFDLAAAGYSLPSSSSSSSNEYDPPLLVSGTDGVGTKLRIATELNAHSTVGIDLVAMSVNDLLVQGAEPLFFLDYFACGKLDVAIAAEVVKGVVEGCRDAGCALVGGETAEMPGMYAGDDYDIAGFAVGAVLRSQLLPKIDLIKPGDVLLGIPSSGLHSNGFSLVRKVVSLSGLSYTSPCPFDFPFPTTYTPQQKTLGAALLTPTKIYTTPVLQLLRNPNPALSKAIKALAHITGGGFVENIPRVFPRGVGCAIRCGSYPLMDVFRWIMRVGHVRPEEMARTFNMGVGMVVVVDAGAVGEFETFIEKGELWRIGEIVEGEGVRLLDIEAWAA